ncbi:hypothetical protein ACFYST_01365 [Kitasatospora sp. NPDC004614]|uniref:hypothetical protein n=1 Tax=unclassified Kitasatospora TaxID=2633591 RepID=UPI0036C893DF
MTSFALVPNHDAPGHDVPPEQAVVVVDMKGYSRLPEAQMAPVRSCLDRILEAVFTQSGLPAPHTLEVGHKDAGDGVILVLPPRHAARLVDPMLANLSAALQRYEGIRTDSEPVIRLRAAVNVGPLSLPGYRGDAINNACRLVNSDAAYQAVEAAVDNGLFLATVLSEAVYQRSVQAGRTSAELTDRHFLSATAKVTNKPDFEAPCRLFVPGMTANSLRGYLPDLGGPAKRTDPPCQLSEPGQPVRTTGAVFNFHAPLNDSVVASDVHTLHNGRRIR